MSALREGGGASPNAEPGDTVESVSIIGLGASGRAAARLARARGETVYVSDVRTEAGLEAAARELRELGARVELGRHDVERISASERVVVSPGIPPSAPVLRELRRRGVEWIGEPEFALGFHTGALIAVTGTNGKTTTALMIAHLLNHAGVEAVPGGNVGGGLAPPASEVLLDHPSPAWLVLEMSSFQLADTRDFSPDIGVVTSLAPDHLDRYASLAEYYADKARLFRNAHPASHWVLNADNPAVLELPGDAAGERHYYSVEAVGRFGGAYPTARLVDGMLTLELGEGHTEALVPLDALQVLGRHNAANALAASLAAHLAGAAPDDLRDGLVSFQPLPHRMEPVGELEGVLWVNDSKATNVEATGAALDSLDRPLVVLLGGKDKGEDFSPLRGSLERSSRAAVLFGEARARLETELGGPDGTSAPCRLIREDRDFDDAVRTGAGVCEPGDLLLLSPACSSFDAFRNYEERGRRFAALAAAASSGSAGIPSGSTETASGSTEISSGRSDTSSGRSETSSGRTETSSGPTGDSR